MRKNRLESKLNCRAGLLGLSALLALAGCQNLESDLYPHADEEIGAVRDVYSATLMPDIQVNTYRNTDRFFATRTIVPGDAVYELPYIEDKVIDVSFTVENRPYDFYDFVSLNRVAGFLVLKDGKIAHESYHLGNSEQTRWMSMSVAKSITATLAGVALHDGYIESLDDAVSKYVSALEGSEYERVSVRQLLQMTSGIQWTEPYSDPTSDRRDLLEAQIAQEPGGMLQVMSALPRAVEPGTVWNYSTGETQVLAELVVAATGRPLSDYFSEKIWARFGMESDALWWLDSPGGVEVGGSGISATLRDYGRFGQFLLNDGVINGESILPPGWIEDATTAPDNVESIVPYGYMWWPTIQDDGIHGPAYEAKGLYGQRIYINPQENVVIVLLCAWPKSWLMPPPVDDYGFFEAVMIALRD